MAEASPDHSFFNNQATSIVIHDTPQCCTLTCITRTHVRLISAVPDAYGDFGSSEELAPSRAWVNSGGLGGAGGCPDDMGERISKDGC